MIKRILLLLALLVVLVACGGEDDENSDSQDNQPTPTVEMAAPTALGPSVGVNLGQTDEDDDCPLFPEEGDDDCGPDTLGPVTNLDLEASMIEQEVLGVKLDVPQDFEKLESEDKVTFVPAEDKVEDYPGDVQINVEWMTAAELESLLENYVGLNEDERIEYSEPVSGYTISAGDEATVGVWEVEEDRLLVIRGSATSVWHELYGELFTTVFTSVEL